MFTLTWPPTIQPTLFLWCSNDSHQYVYSDRGSQLIAASKELKTLFKQLNWDRIIDSGLEWVLSPAEAPWYNGCCESLIRSIKKCLQRTIGEQKLSYNELQTFLYETANLLNERPIGKILTTPEDGSYLCPNDLLLGRTFAKAPNRDFSTKSYLKRRVCFVQEITNIFWKKWTTFYFASLIVRKKWHHEERTVALHDIVIIYQKDLPRG